MQQEVINAELAECHLFVENTNSRYLILEDSVRRVAGDARNLIHEAIKVEQFIVGGSWGSILMQNAIAIMFEDD